MDFFCKSSDHHCKNQSTQKCIQLEQEKMKSVTVVLRILLSNSFLRTQAPVQQKCKMLRNVVPS